ncbi:hypothetical protein [Candidatus Oleimmundimicrobium sp.]|uniref:hypothetical protein n=1 Tax=Candidatus Oleimmundimicrobium sp. TaxID=3060597 RepID=UPI00271E7EA5|nr:hypothetical protein [Candidatus Oleimmundimicrobium sp.]MDO8885722.1 hypothetical protein [Candidatus Oleimmundimicrobium sp.]
MGEKMLVAIYKKDVFNAPCPVTGKTYVFRKDEPVFISKKFADSLLSESSHFQITELPKTKKYQMPKMARTKKYAG